MDIGYSIERVVMQPTSLCNLNCEYCYLPERSKNLRMPLIVAERAASSVAELKKSIEIIWHAGEPLSCGLPHFSNLVSCFEELRVKRLVRHAIQTNGTLINESWADFFLQSEFRVGISLDGPSWANSRRTDWNGKEIFADIMNGINHLKERGVPFDLICVVSYANLDKADELYDFICGVGCEVAGFNIEEQLGDYSPKAQGNEEKVLGFWKKLYRAWDKNPVIKVREFTRAISSLNTLCDDDNESGIRIYDAFPSIAHNGDVVMLAPEFIGANSAPKYPSFVIDNILRKNLAEIIEKGKESPYVKDFITGISKCKIDCEYFETCYGGQAGNKFFETGNLSVTETAFCRNSEKRLIEAVLYELNSQGKEER